MQQKGFFGAIVLLAGAALLLSINSFSAKNTSGYQHIENEMMQMRSASLERSQSEIYIDSAMNSGLQASLVPPVEAQKTKIAVNLAVLLAFEELGLDAFMCDQSGNKIAELSEHSLDFASKSVVTKTGPLTTSEYIFTGGEESRADVCAKLSRSNYSVMFRIPAGYKISMTVPWQ